MNQLCLPSRQLETAYKSLEHARLFREVNMRQNKILHCMVAADPNCAEADHDRLTVENLQIFQDQIQPCEDLVGVNDTPRHQVKTRERIENWLGGIGAGTKGGNSKPTST